MVKSVEFRFKCITTETKEIQEIIDYLINVLNAYDIEIKR